VEGKQVYQEVLIEKLFYIFRDYRSKRYAHSEKTQECSDGKAGYPYPEQGKTSSSLRINADLTDAPDPQVDRSNTEQATRWVAKQGRKRKWQQPGTESKQRKDRK